MVASIILLGVISLLGYLFYRYVFFDILCKKSVDSTLKKYAIKKTQFEIILEYYKINGKTLTNNEASKLEKYYRQHEPEQFLIMYDSIRDNFHNDENT